MTKVLQKEVSVIVLDSNNGDRNALASWAHEIRAKAQQICPQALIVSADWIHESIQSSSSSILSPSSKQLVQDDEKDKHEQGQQPNSQMPQPLPFDNYLIPPAQLNNFS